MDYSLLGSSVHEILQARTLEWVAVLFSFFLFFFVCVIKFYSSIKETEKASDIGIRRGQKSTPFARVSNGVIYSPMNPKNVWRL